MKQTKPVEGPGAANPAAAPGAPEPDYSTPRPGETWVDRLSRKLGDKVAWFFLIAALLTCIEVASDAFFNSPTIWVHDSSIMLCATAFLIGGAYAMQRDEHIRITVIYDALGPRVRWVLDLITQSLTLVYLLVLSAITGVQAAESIRIVEHSGHAWDIPMPMIVRTMFFLGAALLALQTGSSLYRHWRDRRQAR